MANQRLLVEWEPIAAFDSTPLPEAVTVEFVFRPMTALDAQAIADWHYPEPYAFYDWRSDLEDLAELLNPQGWIDRYYAVLDESGDLIGFVELQSVDGAVEIGLGLRPDRTGKGMGHAFLLAILDFARGRYAPTQFRLSVTTFNKRAISVYERAGFRRLRIYMHRTNGGDYEFMEMVRNA